MIVALVVLLVMVVVIVVVIVIIVVVMMKRHKGLRTAAVSEGSCIHDHVALNPGFLFQILIVLNLSPKL